MTKSITVAERQTRDFAEKKYTVGLDLGGRWSWYCVLDERGEGGLEHHGSTRPRALREGFGVRPHSRVALETGTHSPWVSRLMKEVGHEVIVAQASKVRLIGESRKKDDRLDARTLARLARVDPELLGPMQHRSARAQADLIMIRARAGLGRARAALINAARGLTKSYGERLQGCNPRDMDADKRKGLGAELQLALEPLLRAIESLSQQILEYNERIEQMAGDGYPEVARLRQVKGVGTLIALPYVLTLEDTQRFTKSREAGCYVGLQPGGGGIRGAVRRSCTSARKEILTYER